MPQIRKPAVQKSSPVSVLLKAQYNNDQVQDIPTPSLSNSESHIKPNASDSSLASLDTVSDGSGCRCACSLAPKTFTYRTDADGCSYYEANNRLYMHHEAPPVLQFNRYIKSGYRAGLDYKACLRSIFQHHNETGNILTHLAPLIIITFGLMCGFIQPWETTSMSFWLNIASMMLMLTLSVAYHCFSANHHTYHFWLHIDVCGILCVLVGGTHFPMWWGLHCSPLVRAVLITAYYSVWGWCLFAVLRADNANARAAPMLCLLTIRVTTLLTRAFLIGGTHSALQHYIIAELSTFIGGFLNATRLPERLFQPKKPYAPGIFDYWFNSHQLMHVAVVVSCVQQLMGAYDDYNYYELSMAGESMCPAF